jgi:murein endopeptidase
MFAKRIDAEVPIFADVYERMVRSVARAAVVQLDLENAQDPVAAAASAADSLSQNLRGAKEGAEAIRKATAEWPRMTTAMNRARRRAVEALDKLISEYQRAIDVTDVVIGNLRGRP